MLPAVLSVEFNLLQGRKIDFASDELCTFAFIKTSPLSSRKLKFELLAHLDKLSFQMLILHCHRLYTIMLLVWHLNDLALVAADDTELTGALVALKIFLEHLRVTAKV